MKKTLLALAILSTAAHADEGMWMPQQLPQVAKQLKAAGLKLDPATLTKLTEFPMGAIVSLGGCSASFVSPQGLVATNHHCVYGSVAHNSTPERNLLANGFLAHNLGEEVPAAPGTRIWVTKAVTDVSKQVVTPEVAKLNGKARSDAIEKHQKSIQAECEKDAGHRCTVSSYYGGLEFYLIKQLEIRDVRLVHAPAEGVGKFGGDTDNWMWPRHTGDYGFYRAYVSKDGKAADFSKDNVPYVPQHFLKLAKEGVKEGDFIMVLGYPGRTNRHRLPSEVAFTFDWNYPAFVKQSAESLAIIADTTKDNKDTALKYASQVASINNYYKNRQGMLDSYAGSDMLQRKTAEHEALKQWINADAKRKAEYASDIEAVEKLIAQRDAELKQDYYLGSSKPRLLNSARVLYRLANENTKPDAERKSGYQVRDVPRIKASVDALVRNYDEKVDKALVLNSLSKYAAQPAAQRNAAFDAVAGIKDGMSKADLQAALDKLYAGSKLGDANERKAWLERKPEDFKASDDSFIKAAVALYGPDLKAEAEEEELGGKLQQAYANYMKAKIAYMHSKGQAVYPDANSTLRVTFGKIAGRDPGADGTTWKAFTTVEGVAAKATGQGEFNAPAAQLKAIKAKEYGKYADPLLKTVPVNYLATLDITGGNSGSAALNSKGEWIGLAFDGTLDSIISDWDFNKKMTRDIQVDLRYILWNMKHIDHADNLLKEMGAE
ncbi:MULTISPECIES: S46 family peptidase [unclassified Duganella]|uniref:S46 family peptidase n=1 Tax=unclassified Duganella TaxID=2636909 RepID=UPI00088705B8|nr:MULTISPECIES: S46 family peptidase [unclassified Duganella]SDG15088.1 Peptidase S46 [Duganella sp. OV458]SDJ32919.1 dipeptidyl-peptidase 7. Serine peptidase. MEROPS family S46 [Duganella sp. OV510]